MEDKFKNEYGDVALLVFFEGRVQGVSFRFTTNDYAKKAFLSGYVENTSDFEVKALFVGQIEDINYVIHKLINEFDVRNTRAERIPIGKLDIEFTPHRVIYPDKFCSMNSVSSVKILDYADLYGDDEYDYGY